MTEHVVLPLKAHPGMPSPAPVAMPVQDLRLAPVRWRQGGVSWRVAAARLVAFGGAAALAAIATREMVRVVSSGGITTLEALMTAVLAVTFCWISLAASSAVAGLVAPPARHIRPGHTGGALASRNALVMPVFQEDPARTSAALEAMARGLQEIGEARAFEIVILSDSTKADVWVAETLAVDRLRSALRDVMPVWYRRRWVNAAKKSGNVRDFVETWGGRYDHFILLDADSLMSPEALVALAAAMEKDPKLGILQTVPMLAGGATVFARMQQFAARVHGPVMACGLAAWQGSDGTYWGHNAILRTAAFASACGLPELPGREPLGGHILSHDFVEAALMRRAGWRVEMAARLGGSWEESPPSLIHAAVRDRRWAQGNLQHSRVISARGLKLASRAHLAMGMMSYLASPLWLLLIVGGFALGLEAHFAGPESLTDPAHAAGPALGSSQTTRLFLFSLAFLLLPKLIGLLRALLDPGLRRGCGGAPRLLGSFLLELVVSALLAPVMMMIHSRQIYEILAGRDSGWSERQRDTGETEWGDAWRRHRWHFGFGLAMGLAAFLLSPTGLAWLSAPVAGLLLAAPLSKWSGSARLGAALRRAGLLLTPEEREPPVIFQARSATMARLPGLPADGVHALATGEAVRNTHFRWTSSAPRFRGAPDAAYLTAIEKVRQARTLGEALAWLDPPERIQIAGHRALAEQLAALPRLGGTGTRAVAPIRPALIGRLLEPARVATPAA